MEVESDNGTESETGWSETEKESRSIAEYDSTIEWETETDTKESGNESPGV